MVQITVADYCDLRTQKPSIKLSRRRKIALMETHIQSGNIQILFKLSEIGAR